MEVIQEHIYSTSSLCTKKRSLAEMDLYSSSLLGSPCHQGYMWASQLPWISAQSLVLKQGSLAQRPIILNSLEARSTQLSCNLLVMSPQRTNRALLGLRSLPVPSPGWIPTPLSISSQQLGPSIPRRVCTPAFPRHI